MTNFVSVKHLLILLSTAVVLLQACDPVKLDAGRMYCDAEVVEDGYFVGKGWKFAKGKTQSSEHAYEGEYACKVSPEQEYGMSIGLSKAKPGEHYVATVWRYSETGKGILSIGGEDLFEKAHLIRTGDNGWEQLGIEFTIPDSVPRPVSVGIWMPPVDSATAWFDNLEIRRIDVPELPVDEESLRLTLDETAMAQIEAKRAEAMELGLLIKAKGDWVSGELLDGPEFFETRMRLKGDWTDHLVGHKWSFRVELRKDERWQGLEEFSIQAPQTRYNTHEWLWHKMLQTEGVISPRYDFRYVVLNGVPRGWYAVEQHFDRHLLKDANRPNGPIFRFNENEIWQGVLHSETTQPPGHPYFEAAWLDPYGNPEKSNPEAWEAAQKGALHFQFGIGKASDFLDAEKWAVYIASIDVLGARHTQHWTNLRFYYNPETQLIEPIGYDGFSSDGPENSYRGAFTGHHILTDTSYVVFPSYWRFVLNDPVMARAYLAKLEQFTAPAYLQQLQDSLGADAKRFTDIIVQEQPLYTFDWAAVNARAEQVRLALNGSRSQLENGVKSLPYRLPLQTVAWNNRTEPQENVTVRAWRHNGAITVACFSPMEIEVKAIGSEEQPGTTLGRKIVLPPYVLRERLSVTTMPDAAGDWLYYTEGDSDKQHKTPITEGAPPPWPSAVVN